MNGRIIQDRHRLARQTAHPCIDTLDDKRTVDALGTTKTHQLAPFAQPGQHVQARAVLARTLQRVLGLLPAVRHHRQQAEARFVTVEHLNQPFALKGLQVRQQLDALIVIGGTKAAGTASDALVSPTMLFKKRWRVLWLNSRCSSWRRAVRAAFNCWALAATCWLTSASSAGVRMAFRPRPG